MQALPMQKCRAEAELECQIKGSMHGCHLQDKHESGALSSHIYSERLWPVSFQRQHGLGEGRAAQRKAMRCRSQVCLAAHCPPVLLGHG